MKEILSTKNTLIKERKKLQKRKNRQLEGRYLIEGFHLVEEALKNNHAIEELFVDERGLAQLQEWAYSMDENVYFVSDEVMASLSELPTPQGMIALLSRPQESEINYHGKWLLLDNVQDPGNVGTMIRTADAAGFDGVILGNGTADLYSSKVLRSMQGSNFHLPVLTKDLATIVPLFQQAGVKVFGTELNTEALSFNELPKLSEVVLILGNEGQGVSKEILALTDANVFIPLYGQAESLNVGVASGILMYAFV